MCGDESGEGVFPEVSCRVIAPGMKYDILQPVPAPARLQKYKQLVLAQGADEARIISARNVVTAEWVRLKCQYECSGYNKRLCCPPFSPVPEKTRQVLQEYRWAVIYAYNGARLSADSMQRFLAQLERTAFLDGYYKAFGFGAGPCRFCATCRPGERCKFPELARPAMEACGIDVYATCRNVGIRLEVVKDRRESPRYVNLLLVE